MNVRLLSIAFSSLFFWLMPQFALSNVIIDNFTTGNTPRFQVTCNLKDNTQPGSMAGGARRTRLIVNQPGTSCNPPNQYRQTASMQVRAGGTFLLGSDFKVFHRLEVFYGQDVLNNVTPLNLDLTEGGLANRRIRIVFDGMDLVENFNIVLFMHDGSARSACSMNISPGISPFTIDFPLANFGTALGTADYTDVDFIALIFQSGSAIGANDFAVKSVIATSNISPTAIVSTCS